MILNKRKRKSAAVTIRGKVKEAGISTDDIIVSVKPEWSMSVRPFPDGQIEMPLNPPPFHELFLRLKMLPPGHHKSEYSVDPGKISKGIVSLGRLGK